jgi:hypothetical protein
MEQQTVSEVAQVSRGNAEDHEYDQYLARLRRRFDLNTITGEVPLFTTDAYKRHDTTLWDAYLNSFPPEERQYHTCSACRHFIQRYGTLVTIEAGRTTPAIWDEGDAPDLYKTAVAAMARLVRRAKVTGIFLSEQVELGQSSTRTERCTWRHFAVTNPRVFKRITKTAKQTQAERREDYNTVSRSLSEITPATLQQAVTLLKTEALWRSEKVLGGAEWLLAASEERRSLTGALRDNALWRAIALAPAGFCHPRSSMIGTLLEDIEAGLPFEDVRRKFAAKMNPTIYQRPQAAPSAGNIAQAEKLVEQLGIAPSLKRRFARLDDILEKLWEPRPAREETKAAGGVFGHLKPKGSEPAAAMRVPPVVMTWEKFKRTVLPEARSIELLAPMRGNYEALVTASDPEAPPILQWDSPERRNPVSWYVYSGGSIASQWGLAAGAWVKVVALSANPPHWFGREMPHQADGVLFVLEGCRDSRWASSGLGLFPECLKSELREVKSTIEAYSHRGQLEGYEESSACGIKISKGQASDVHVRVFGASGAPVEYQIDRWD